MRLNEQLRARAPRVPAVLAAASLLVAGLVAVPTASAAAAEPAPTGCDTSAARDGQELVLQLQVPADASWQGVAPTYAFDARDDLGAGFDRVGYCLETSGADGDRWAWAGMQAFTDDPAMLGLHTRAGEVTQQRVVDLGVASNVPGVTAGEGLTGWIEHWPNTYRTSRSGQVGGASDASYDTDDQPTTGWHGSFQVHEVNDEPRAAGAPSTVMALNGFTSTTDPLAVGFGTAPTGEPDWTFAANGATFETRTLSVFARPAVVSLTTAPQDRQLYPRDAAGGSDVVVAGTAAPAVTRTRLTVVGAEGTQTQESDDAQFSFTSRITAGLHDYDVRLEAETDGSWRAVGHWTHVVSGDAFVIQGQSNAESAVWEDGSDSTTENQSPWVRSFGTTAWNPDTSTANRAWQYAYGDMTSTDKGDVTNAGMVGQWGMRMGGLLSQELGVPVAIVNGAHGGQRIGFFQRNDADPTDRGTNYGRLLQRLDAAGLTDDVRAVLWYQGESDLGDVETHLSGFTSLLADWRADLGADALTPTRYYAFQIRTSCNDNGGRSGDIALREAQRNLSRTHDVTVLSTTGAPAHIGCHFGYEGGYEQFGEQAAAAVLRDLDDGPADGVAAPEPLAASAPSVTSESLTVELRTADPLTIDPDITSTGDWVLDGTTAHVTDVAQPAPGVLEVSLDGPVGPTASLTYLSHQGEGPMVRTSRGVGLLAFNRLPVDVEGSQVLDHADLGDALDEAAHGLTATESSGTSIEAGLTRRYAGQQVDFSSFELDVAVTPGKPFVVRSVETYDRTQTKRYKVYVDGEEVHLREFTHTGSGTETYDITVPARLATSDTVRLKFESQDDRRFYDPSIADVWTFEATDEPVLDVAVEAQPRCLAGRAYVAVRATNGTGQPVALTLTTPFGTRTFSDVDPQANAYQSFASRTTSVDAGEATATVRAVVDGTETTGSVVAAYGPIDCA